MRTCVPVENAGSDYIKLRRALERGRLPEAIAHATDMPHVPLPEALGLLLLMRDNRPTYERASARFAGRVALELRPSPEQLQLLVAALASTRAHPVAGLPATAAVFDSLGHHEIAAAVDPVARGLASSAGETPPARTRVCACENITEVLTRLVQPDRRAVLHAPRAR